MNVRQQRAGPAKPVSPNIFDGAVDIEQLPDSGYKVLIFGESGTGKTTFACTFPKPLLLIRPEEVEDGSRSVRKVAGVRPTPFLTTPDQLEDVCEGQKRTKQYKTIVLDGGTKFQDLVVKKHMGMEDVPVQQTWGMVPQADWNLIGITVKTYLRNLLRLAGDGTHVVIVAGERALGEGSDNKTSVQAPRVMAAFTPSITGWVHDVCDFNVSTFKRPTTVMKVYKVQGKDVKRGEPGEGSEYCARLDDTLYGTKFRVPKGTPLPPVMLDPTFAKIDDLVQGRVGARAAGDPVRVPGSNGPRPAPRPAARK